jgi:hypothetical protein
MTEMTRATDILKSAIQKHQQESTPTGTGEMLLFKRGVWTRGRDKLEVPEGTRFKPNPFEFWHGWQRFEDGHVAGLNLRRFFEGAPGDPPDEEDGWQRNWRIVMQDEQANLLTFSTTSFGGKLAWDELLEAYGSDTEHAELWPVVAVRTCYYDTKQYKHVPRPTFEIVSWAEPWASPSGTLPEPNTEAKAIEAPKVKKAAKAGKAEFDEANPPPCEGLHDEPLLFDQEA